MNKLKNNQVKHRNIKITIAYKGNNYYGLQKLPDKLNVVSEIEKACFKVFNQTPKILAAGRTDAKVHALNQVLSFYIDTKLSKQEIKSALNANLPLDIRIIKVEYVGYDFHARFKAIAREYKYFVLFNTDKNTFIHLPENFYIIKENIEINKMQEASKYLKGKHDFSTFAKGKYNNPIREIKKLSIQELLYYSPIYNRYFNLCEIKIKANSFLRQMVRLIVAALLEVGKEKIPPEEINVLLDLKNNYYNYPPVPGYALFLDKVYYKKD